MEKMKMQSENLVDENVEKIAKLFPNCITEGKDEDGKVVRAVDFDLLKQELSKDLVEGNDERYTLNWAGKKQSILTANSPINATLRPCEKESVGKDGTPGGWDSQNLYIEGDNLDVLKLLRETYLNKIKMIYIDPPYNTGNDFVYNDDFATSADEYLQNSKSYDEDGNRMVQNLESNGRFHSDWLSMMYPRLKLARDLLTDDGVIFISIDYNELANLQKICDEIFGTINFITIMPRKTTEIVRVLANYELQNLNDYILVYCKNISCVNFIKRIVGEMKYEFTDQYGNYTLKAFQNSGENGTRSARPNLYYPIYFNQSDNSLSLEKRDGDIEILPRRVMNDDGRWLWSKEKFLQDKRFLEYKNGTLYRKVYFNPDVDQNKYQAEKTWLDMFPNRLGAKSINDLKLNGYFDYTKPVELIQFLIRLISKGNDYILDFFSGSATTAHAVMQLNAEDGDNRKFIMVQLPEKTDEKSEAYKAGYKNICEIGKERIRRAGKKIISPTGTDFLTALHRITGQDKVGITGTEEEIKNSKEYKEYIKNQDIGFRVLKLDSSNMKDVYYTPAETPQGSLLDLVSNIKEDRSPEDLLFQVMLDMGVMLDSKIEKIELSASKQAFNVNDGNLICCFDINLSEEDVTKIAKMQPLYAVFRDSSMSSDSVAVNFDQIFETYSPSTTRKVL